MEINAPCWVDTHIHWDASEFDVDREQALVRAKQAGVIACFNPSVIASGFESVRDLAAASLTRCDWPRILPAYGVHPLYVMQATDADLAALEQQLVMHRPLAVGEIGLDGYPGAPDMTQQRTWFEAQLALAAKYSLPVLLHVRHAVEDVIQCLKRVQGQRQKIPGGIAHAFNGSENQAEQLMRMGFMLGFGGSLTYEGSTRIRRLAASLPLEHVVLETDAPDMAPSWLERARNESSELPKIANILANLRGISLRRLAEQTSNNAQKIIAGAGLVGADGACAHSS